MTEHFHKNEDGVLIRCYHVCKKKAPPIGWWIFFTTISFPIEHALWELTPLHYITGWFGIH